MNLLPPSRHGAPAYISKQAPIIPPPPCSLPTLAILPLFLHCSHSESMGNALSSLCTPFPDDFYESVLSFAVASSRQPMLTTQDEIECHSYDSSLSLFCLHSLSFPPPLSLSLLILIVAHYTHSLNITLFAYFLSISPPSWKYNESNN